MDSAMYINMMVNLNIEFAKTHKPEIEQKIIQVSQAWVNSTQLNTAEWSPSLG